MGRLSDNQVFTLKVKELHPNFDNYSSNSGSGQMYCHKFIMTDGEEDFVCQWCNEFAQISEYRVGDILKIQIKSFKKNIHNMVPLSKTSVVRPEPPEKTYEPISQPKEGPRQGDPIAAYPNPQIAGTMIDRAMTNAIAYYRDNEVPFQSVTKLADEILDWYKKQFNPNN